MMINLTRMSNLTSAMISKQWLLMTRQWEKTHISCLVSENEAQTAVILTISNDGTGNSVLPEHAAEKKQV